MEKTPWYYAPPRVLLAVAGGVWLLAGFNVARLGVIAYRALPAIAAVHAALSLAVFCAFGAMFARMTGKHAKRILGSAQEKSPIWSFFDAKSYCIMVFMMGGGIWLRSSGLAPAVFIAVFYTGLGCALAVAGVLFWKQAWGAKPPRPAAP